MSLQAAVDALVLVRDELERVDVSQQRRVGVDDFFHVGGRDLRAVERDGQVAAPEDVKNGEATLPRGETLNVQALRGERGRELLVRQHAAEVAKVVAKLGRGAVLPADGEEQFALFVRLYDVVERVVLEDHRRRLAPEESFA